MRPSLEPGKTRDVVDKPYILLTHAHGVGAGARRGEPGRGEPGRAACAGSVRRAWAACVCPGFPGESPFAPDT